MYYKTAEKNRQTLVLCILLCLKAALSFSQCNPTGPNNPSSTVNNNSIGSVAWTNPANAQAIDNAYASCGTLLGVLGSAQTNYMICTGFGLSVPVTATVCGIQVDIIKNAAGLLIGSSIKDNVISIIKNGSMTGSNKASGAAWPGTNSTATYGSNADLWSAVWTPADINAGNFGVAISAQMNAGLASLFLTANVDQVSITVYYNNGTLPIEMVSFTGRVEGSKVKLDWQTASEINNDYFLVEKMIGENNWSPIAYMAGAGNSIASHHYTIYDQSPDLMNYYRVKQTDLSSQYSYSEIIAISYNGPEVGPLSVFPVPASDYLHLKVKNKVDKIEVISSNGFVVSPDIVEEKDGLVLNISTLAPGLYIAKVYTDIDPLETKFIKE